MHDQASYGFPMEHDPYQKKNEWVSLLLKDARRMDGWMDGSFERWMDQPCKQGSLQSSS